MWTKLWNGAGATGIICALWYGVTGDGAGALVGWGLMMFGYWLALDT